MAEEGEDQSAEALANIERLHRNLTKDTLASRLVQAYADPGGSLDAMRRVLSDRLDQVRWDIGQD